jgi:hypothetical protein
MKLLTTQADREEAASRLRELLGARGEWFCAESRAGRERAPFALRTGEWEIRDGGNALHFSCWTDAGARTWRVAAWECVGGRVRLRVTRRMGAERSTLELVPRASAREGALAVAFARRAACERMAQTICAHAPGMKIESARLSVGARRSEPGRYARVLLASASGAGRRELIAATGPVVLVKAHEIDDALASALSWWSRLADSTRVKGTRGKPRLWLVVSCELSGAMSDRVALLREEVREAIRLFEYEEALPLSDEALTLRIKASSSSESAVAESESIEGVGEAKFDGREVELVDESAGGRSLTPVEIPRLDSLLTRATRFSRLPREGLSEIAERLVALAPAEIDVIRARRGETLRFNGIAFARVRRVLDDERVWFGVQGAGQKVLLDEGNWRGLAKLIDELKEHRRADAVDPRHAYYRAAPEAWLESILRRDITRLDPGLVVSPLHVQLRTSRESAGASSRPVDLLALRRDGRLVVIELKVSEDAALPIQGADYWRRISTHHRGGHIERARLFGDAEISDEPPLVYLVAPMLRFHRSFRTLAHCVAPDVEMYRFDINEDWRAGVRVMGRDRVV